MFALIYTSDAIKGMDKNTLTDILDNSISFNAENDITGVLIYREHRFMQMLEGDENTVKNLYARICQDARHYNCQIAITQKIEQRNLAHWSMGFLPVDKDGFNHQYVEYSISLIKMDFHQDSKQLHEALTNFAIGNNEMLHDT